MLFGSISFHQPVNFAPLKRKRRLILYFNQLYSHPRVIISTSFSMTIIIAIKQEKKIKNIITINVQEQQSASLPFAHIKLNEFLTFEFVQFYTYIEIIYCYMITVLIYSKIA